MVAERPVEVGRPQEGDEVASCDVVLVDDHPMLAAGLISGLGSRGITMLTTPVLEIPSVLDFVDDHQPQLVLLDFHVPPIGTSEVFFEPLTARSIGYAILTGHLDEALWGRLLESGARGVVSKANRSTMFWMRSAPSFALSRSGLQPWSGTERRGTSTELGGLSALLHFEHSPFERQLCSRIDRRRRPGGDCSARLRRGVDDSLAVEEPLSQAASSFPTGSRGLAREAQWSVGASSD